MNVNSLLRNKYVLYAVLFLAISNIVGYLTIRDFRSITLFVAIALLTSHFTKNMIVTLGSAMVFTSMFAASNLLEGMKSKSEDEESEEDKDKDMKSMEPKKEGEKEGMDNASSKKGKKGGEEDCPEGHSMKDGKCVAKSGFAQRNVPSSSPAPATESEEDEEIGKRIDYASTLEQAYDNLQGILGAKGMDGLTKETQKLIKQQSSLMETLNTMTPVLTTAKSTLEKFDVGNLSKSLNSLQGLVKGKQ